MIPDFGKLGTAPALIGERVAAAQAERRAKPGMAPATQQQRDGSGQSSLFGKPAQQSFGPDGGYKTVEAAAALLTAELNAFKELKTPGNGRSHILAQRLGVLAGHGVPAMWTEEAAMQSLMEACEENGFAATNGYEYAEQQARNGVRFGMREPWHVREVTYTQEVQPEPVNTGRLRKAMLKRSEVHSLPEPEPLIEHVLYRGSVVMLSGKFGTYKSFVAVSWAASLATGKPWFGYAVPEAVPVIYAAAEGAYGIRKRLDAWEAANGQIPDSLYLLPLSVRLNRPDDMLELEELIKETGAQVLVFDTLHMSTPGVDENDAGEMGKVMDVLRTLQEKYGLTSILPHHTGHGGERARGSSSIEDDADIAFVIKIDGEDRSAKNPRTLIHRKTKDDATIDPIVLKLELVESARSGYVTERTSFEDAAGTEEAPDLGQVDEIREPQEWTKELQPHPKAEMQRRILQTLHDIGGTVGRTESQVQRLVASRWHRGETGRGAGKLNVQAFQKAWTAVLTLCGQGGEAVVVRLEGQKYGLDSLSVKSE